MLECDIFMRRNAGFEKAERARIVLSHEVVEDTFEKFACLFGNGVLLMSSKHPNKYMYK